MLRFFVVYCWFSSSIGLIGIWQHLYIESGKDHELHCDIFAFLQIVDELREQILKLRFPHRVQNKEATPKTKRKIVGHPSPSKSPSIPAPKPALSDRPCVVVLNKPLEKLLIRSVHVITSHHNS